jgi:hypothetical protein
MYRTITCAVLLGAGSLLTAVAHGQQQGGERDILPQAQAPAPENAQARCPL